MSNELYYKDVLHLLNTSIIMAEVDQFDGFEFDVTTCQDILHSVHKLRGKLTDTLDRYISDEELDCPPGSKFEKLLVSFIQQALRPFEIYWHGKLFKIDSVDGYVLRTLPRVDFDYLDCKAFRDDYHKLRTATELLISDIIGFLKPPPLVYDHESDKALLIESAYKEKLRYANITCKDEAGDVVVDFSATDTNVREFCELLKDRLPQIIADKNIYEPPPTLKES